MSKILPLSAARTEPLIKPIRLFKEFPKTIAQKIFIEQSREQIFKILNRTDPRFLLVIGPCSIHDAKAARHYAKNLKGIIEVISDTFFPVMRFYFEKPRTAMGWTGIMHDPHLNSSLDLNTGIRLTRQLLVELAQMGVPAAAEIVDPISATYFGDLLSWACIGARTSASQIHRQVASGLSLPVAFKNTTDGNIDVAIHGMLRACEPQAYIGINESGVGSIIRTNGNPYCHLILRGSEKTPNYDSKSVQEAIFKLKKAQLAPTVMIDCSHDNSNRDHNNQPEVFERVIDQILSGNQAIRGCILESHIRAGNQQLSDPSLLKYGISITDPCMDWETTEGILFAARKALLSKLPDFKNVPSKSQQFALI